MHYCTHCKKQTNDSIQGEFSEDFSNTLQIVSCEDCGTFKHQYLGESKCTE